MGDVRRVDVGNIRLLAGYLADEETTSRLLLDAADEIEALRERVGAVRPPEGAGGAAPAEAWQTEREDVFDEYGVAVGQKRGDGGGGWIRILGCYGFGSRGLLYSHSFENSFVTSPCGMAAMDVVAKYPVVLEGPEVAPPAGDAGDVGDEPSHTSRTST